MTPFNIFIISFGFSFFHISQILACTSLGSKSDTADQSDRCWYNILVPRPLIKRLSRNSMRLGAEHDY